jgi:copper homeostasis protein
MISSSAPKGVVSTAGSKVLEVIVRSREEAVEAELYGADRLEVVRSLEDGGLTPEIDVVQAIAETVSIPVRVMVRERNSMSIASREELLRLQRAARSFAALPIDGLVLGFVTGSVIDTYGLREILAAAPQCRVTFHRAFESLRSPRDCLHVLKQFRQIDRVLVRLDTAAGMPQISDLAQWQKLAAPEIKFVVGLGLQRENISRVREQAELSEVHAGRLLREPETVWGRLSRGKFSDLKSALG